MKKFFIVCFCLVASFVAFASPFEANLGLVGQHNSTLNSVLESEELDFTFDDFNLGAEADVKAFFVDINATTFVKRVDDANTLSGVVSANLLLDIFFIRVEAGVGVGYLYDTSDSFRFVGGDIKDAKLYLRAEADFKIQDLRIGVYGNVPTELTINDFNVITFDRNNFWKYAIVGVAIKTSLF